MEKIFTGLIVKPVHNLLHANLHLLLVSGIGGEASEDGSEDSIKLISVGIFL